MPSENQFHNDFNQTLNQPQPQTQIYTATTGCSSGSYGGYQDGSGITFGGHNCNLCGVWISTGCIHTCSYPVYQPQIIIQPTIFPVAMPVEVDVHRLTERLSAIEEKVEKLLELLLNEQDEEVCGHPEGELQGSQFSLGVRGHGRAALEAPQPKGATSWPSHESSE